MAKKNIEGQLDMFELFSSVEELEQSVKAVPELPEEEQIVPFKVPQPGEPVMEKCFAHSCDQKPAVVAYIDYNMVYIRDWKKKPVIHAFSNSKDAVNYYMEQIEHYTSQEGIRVLPERLPLEKAELTEAQE